MEPIPILYDAECRFCRASLAAVLAWDRRRRLRPVALQSEEAGWLLHGMSERERMSSAHLARTGREVVSGGALAAIVLAELPGGGALAWLADRLPGTANRVYSWVAGNRGRLSPLVPGPVSRRADSLVRSRS